MSNYNRGIEYRPNIFYELGKAPPNKYSELIISEDIYVSSSELEEKTEKVCIDIDFLIHKAEERLAKYDGFSLYKPAAIKRYYCQQFTTEEEDNAISVFEDRLGQIDGDMAIDYYKRLLILKRETESDLDMIKSLAVTETQSLSNYIKRLVNYYGLNNDYLDVIYREDLKDKAREEVSILNEIFQELERKKESYYNQYSEAVASSNQERVATLQAKIAEIEKDIKRVKNSLGYTASQSYGLYQKINSSESFVQRLGYMLLATPYDNLDGTICCLLKAILKQLGIDDDLRNLDEKIKSLNLRRIIDAINALRAILALSFNRRTDILKKIEHTLINILMSPVRSLLGKAIRALRDVEMAVISKIYGLFEGIAGDFDNPDNILDCIYLEEFADYIYDRIDDIFDEIESKIIDLYKAIYQQIDLFDQDSIWLFEKAKLKEVYNVLTKFANTLNTIDKFSFSKGVVKWIESFLISNGYGTYYDNEAGTFKTIDLGNCLDPGEYSQYHRPFMPQKASDIPIVNLENNQEYREWIKSGNRITYACDLTTD